MLAGNNIKYDDIYSEAYADATVVQRRRPQHQAGVGSSAQPNARNSQTRKAFKQHKSSVSYNDPPLYSEPIEMGNNEGHPSVDLTGMTPTSSLTGDVTDLPGEHDGCYNQPRKKSVEGKQKNSGRKEIQLGDYTDPPDFKTENKSGIPSPKPTDYSEPYETQQILKKLERRSTKQKREEIYELAGPVSSTDHVTKQSNSPAVNERKYSDKPYREVFCEVNLKQNKFISSSGTSVDSGVDDPDEYDHLMTWNARKDSFNKIDNGQSSPVNTTTEMTSSNEGVSRNAIYAGAYEEPWDSRKSQQQFNDVLEKAESLSPTFKSPSGPVKGNAGGVYEEAWDLRQRELEHTIQEAHRLRSCSSENNNGRPKGINSNFPSGPEQVYAGNYEEPWDSKEKEKELEDRLSKAIIHSPSGSDRPPEYNAPPPPPPQTYEEAWDIRPSSRVISKVAGNRDSNSSLSSSSNSSGLKSVSLQDSLRAGSIKHSAEHGERIDPGLPLDIQKFYHGSISRKVAEDLLLVHKEGSYLIRRSETNQNVFSLSLKGVGGMPMHIRISLQKGEYILGENSQPFPTVPEMVDYFTRHDLPVMKAERIKLLHPVQRSC